MNDRKLQPVSSIPRASDAEAARGEARNTLIARRRSMAPDVRRAADVAIAARVQALLDACTLGEHLVLAAFWPVRSEPDLREAMARWHAGGRTIALPRVAGSERALEFGRWRPGAPMREDVFGIAVPEPFEPLCPTLLIAPCVGFDARGWRLGYGGGYYDRTLGERPVASIGVAYDACQIDGFVPMAHDRRLGAIVTETRTIVTDAAACS